ncbi:MAG: hypothetical protein KF690_08480 [Bacteroidetes bacterium]|nr:hypothetical protein [Bacteroidota bacterium]
MKSSLQQDIRHRFLPRYGAIGWLIILNVGGCLAFVIPLVILFLAGKAEIMYRLWYLSLPTDLAERPDSRGPWPLMFMHV